MEGQSNQEVQAKGVLRAQQREKVWRETPSFFINKPRLEEVISGNDTGGRITLRMLADSLGRQTFPVLFDLASTAKSPMELRNTFSAIGILSSVSWTTNPDSKMALFQLLEKTTFTRTSQEAQVLARKLLERGSIAPFLRQETMGREIFKQYLTEAVFIALASPSHSVYVKESILDSLSYFITNSGVFDQNVSFWRYVDGSWTNPYLESVSSAKNEDSSSERKSNEGFKGDRVGKEKKRSIFEILDLPLTATPEAIKSAYRKRSRAMHPDSLKGGLEKAGGIFSPENIEEMLKVAEQSTKELNQAYAEYQKTQNS